MSREHISSAFNLIKFFVTGKSKVVYVELPVDVFKEHLDFNAEDVLSSHLNIAASIDISLYDEFIRDYEIFWSSNVSDEINSLRFLLKLGWLIKDIKSNGMINPIQLLQSGRGKYKAHPGSARAIVTSYIVPIDTIKCIYVWDATLDPNPIMLNYPHLIIRNPIKFLNLFLKISKFKILTERLTSTSTNDAYFNSAKDGLRAAHSTYNLNLITTKDIKLSEQEIRNKIFLKDILEFSDRNTCALGGVKFIRHNNRWTKQ